MDIKQLKYFISIADLGSMARASELLNIAQPALTQQIAKLEADLRARAFDRGTSGVKLTPAGEVLYRYAKSIIKQVDDARLACSHEDRHPTGKVTIGIPGSTGKLLSVPLLQKLKKQGRVFTRDRGAAQRRAPAPCCEREAGCRRGGRCHSGTRCDTVSDPA